MLNPSGWTVHILNAMGLFLDLPSPSDLSVLETLSDSGPQSSGDEGMGGGGGGGGGGGKRESKRKLLEGAEPFAPKRRSTRVS